MPGFRFVFMVFIFLVTFFTSQVAFPLSSRPQVFEINLVTFLKVR